MNHTVVVLVGRVHRGVLEALAYAKSLSPNRLDRGDDRQRARGAGAHREGSGPSTTLDIPLEIIHSPYRELTRPVMRFVDELDARYENDIVTIVIPEFVVHHWWGHLLHNQSALLLKGRLLFRKDTVVISVPYHLVGPAPADARPFGRSRVRGGKLDTIRLVTTTGLVDPRRSKRILVGRPLATAEQEHQRHPEDDRPRGLLLRRDLVDRVRDRGDPLRHRGRRVEPRARARRR